MTPSTKAFVDGLELLGFTAEIVPHTSDHVVFDYPVESGRFASKKVRLGVIVPPDFPLTPPSGPHVSPHIHPIGKQGQHPEGAVHASPFTKAIGGDWQYWSRPFANWAGTKRSVANYLSHIWRLWDSQ